MPALDRRAFIGLAAASAGTFLLGRAANAQSVLQDTPSGDDYVRINYNENPSGPSPLAREAMHSGVGISGRYGSEPQENLVALFARQHGLPANYVKVYCGSGEALQYAILGFTSPQRSLVCAAPSYDQAVMAAQGWGATAHEVPLTQSHAHDVQGMLHADAQAGLFYVCNPNNPTGTMTSRQDIETLIAGKPKEAVVVIDEAYLHFSDAPSCLDIATKRSDVLVLRTFSKIYGMAGARLGLAVGHPDLLRKLEVFGGGNSVPVSSALGGIASLKDQTLVPQRKQANGKTRDESIAWFRRQGFTCTQSQSNFFMVDVRQPAEQVINALKERKVLIGRVWPSWPNWIRISVGTPADMNALHKAFANALGLTGNNLHSVS